MARIINFPDINTAKLIAQENNESEASSVDQSCRRAGLAGERKVASILAKALPETYLVVNNYSLDIRGKKKDIDHIIIGDSGVFIVETKAWSGTIVPKADGYMRIKGSHIEKRGNPEKQVYAMVSQLKNVLNDHGLGCDWVNTAVCLPQATRIDGKGQDSPVLRPNALAQAILKNKPNRRPKSEEYRNFFLSELAHMQAAA